MSLNIQKIVQNLGILCRQSQVPCISQSTEKFLHNLLRQHKPKQILEIGSAYGYSLLSLGSCIAEWGGSIIGCERAYPNRVEISKMLSLLRYYHIYSIDCIYAGFLKSDPDIRKKHNNYAQYDFVFIDAQKSEYPDYLDYLSGHNLIHPGSIMVFDDVIKYKHKLSNLEEKLLSQHYSIEKYQLDEDDGILIAYKKTPTT